jgi:hypothetical protein
VELVVQPNALRLPLPAPIEQTGKAAAKAVSSCDSPRGERIDKGHLIATAAYESIHKAVQYKNSGAIQTAASMNEIDGITIWTSRKAPNVHSMPKKMRPLHESIVKVSQRASVFATQRLDPAGLSGAYLPHHIEIQKEVASRPSQRWSFFVLHVLRDSPLTFKASPCLPATPCNMLATCL